VGFHSIFQIQVLQDIFELRGIIHMSPRHFVLTDDASHALLSLTICLPKKNQICSKFCGHQGAAWNGPDS
jgi:hypothetical protein